MNTSQLLGLLRRYIKESWSREQRLLKDTPDYYARKAEYEGALKALMLLDALAWAKREEERAQPTLGGEG